MKPIELISHDHIKYWSVNIMKSLGVNARYYLRPGGVSQGVFHSLNHGYNLGDNKGNVKKNRQLVFKTGRFGPLQPALVNQTHSTKIVHVQAEHSGQGWIDEQHFLPDADGLVTTTPGLPIAIKTADCLPVMLADLHGQSIAILHAGWRGLVHGILGEGITYLTKLVGIKANHVLAVLGPCLSQQQFTITSELFELFRPFGHHAIEIKNNLGFVNMHAIARQQLLKLGLDRINIYQVPGCTFTDKDDYFSYRRDQGITGRMLSIMQINP